jgi:hypothetical protein
MCTAVRSCNKQNEVKHISCERKLFGLSNRTGMVAGAVRCLVG